MTTAVAYCVAAALMVGVSCTKSNGTAPTCTNASVQLIQASSYDQTCKVDSDCVGIAEGNLCDHCDCVNAAINVRDEARYQSDISGKVSTQLCKCPTMSVTCNAGTCATAPFFPVRPADAEAEAAATKTGAADAAASATSGDATVGTGEGGDAASGAAACVAAGGQCVQGVAFCANVGPGASPGSCLDVGPGTLCCAANEDAGCTEIQASSYDQTCTKDSDCVKINIGNACEVCVFACGASVDAINVGSTSQYTADVAKTPAGAAGCECPSYPANRLHACCRGGQCQADNECLSLDGSTDSGDASTE